MDNPISNPRPDGTEKSSGFFGALKRPDGKVSTEISIGLDVDGKQINVPLLVPSLTFEELNYLLQSNVESKDFLKNLPPSIMDKAYNHAEQRIKAGLSPFALPNEVFKPPVAPKAQQMPEAANLKYQDPFGDTTR
jgi:hypothetical protein